MDGRAISRLDMGLHIGSMGSMSLGLTRHLDISSYEPSFLVGFGECNDIIFGEGYECMEASCQ